MKWQHTRKGGGESVDKREEKVNIEEGSKRENKIGSGEKDGGEKKCEQEDEVPQEIRK